MRDSPHHSGLRRRRISAAPGSRCYLGVVRRASPELYPIVECFGTAETQRNAGKHHPKHLYISLDGDKSTYRYMRGVDGYEQVMQVIEQWHERIPISLMFCLSPLELVPRHGARHCRGQALWHRCAHRNLQHHVIFRHHFGLDRHGTHRFPAADPPSIHETDENFDFVHSTMSGKIIAYGCVAIVFSTNW